MLESPFDIAATLLKRGSNTGVFLWYLRNCTEHVFLQTTTGSYFCRGLFRTLSSISIMGLFANIGNGYNPLTVFAKSSIVDRWIILTQRVINHLMLVRIDFIKMKQTFVIETITGHMTYDSHQWGDLKHRKFVSFLSGFWEIINHKSYLELRILRRWFGKQIKNNKRIYGK